MRSVFDTGTFKVARFGALLTAISLSTPFAANIISRYVSDQRAKDTIADVAGWVMALTGSTGIGASLFGVAANRASVTDKVYSPSWLPGFNKEQLEAEEQQKQVAEAQPDMHEKVWQLAMMQRPDPADFDRVNISRIPEGVALDPVDMGPQKIVFTNPQDAI